MFKVHVASAELLLEDCRVNANGWLRLSLLHGGAAMNSSNTTLIGSSPSTTSAVDIECLSSIPEERQDPQANPIHAVYGIYSLLSGPYLAVIKDARVIGSGPNSEKLYCMLEADLIPISAAAHRSFFKHASKREQKDELEYIRMIKSVFASRTFYFSYDYDLTLSAQRRATLSTSPSSTSMWQQAEDDFFWNKPVLGPFLTLQLDSWIIPVISGFIKVLKKFEIHGMRCDMIFFTRRSCKRVGTRFNVRGVDKDGYVANFAETEMIIVKPNRGICSYVQIRGSIPLYWDQVVTLKYMPRTRYAFSGNESIVDWNELAFRAHMDHIIQRYGHITVVNLIDKTGTSRTVRDQAQLGTAFGKYVKKYNATSHQDHTMFPPPQSPQNTSKSRSSSNAHSPQNARPSVVATPTLPVSQLFAEPIAYVWFDFHHECRKMQWHHLSKLMIEVQEQFTHYGWFEMDTDGRILARQKGVFRVNCMDNLDRTNVVMSLFARRSILVSLSLYNTSFNVLDSPYEVFEIAFKNTWADNADYISKMYAGTGALKTDFTRTGKRTLIGAIQDGINSVTRYYLNNFGDGIRQDSYDLVVGNYVPDRRDESPFTYQQQHSLLYLWFEICLFIVFLMGVSLNWRLHVPVMIRLRDGAITAWIILFGIGHLILKKGSFRSLGRRYVCKPAFCSSGYIRKKD